jgi:gp16 family phage-associated protein
MRIRNSATRTPEEAKAWFDRHGIPVSEWARLHGFEPAVVFSLLNGRTRGRRGMAHLAAIALGLKANPASDEASPLDSDGETEEPLACTKKQRRETSGRAPATVK